MIPTVTTGDEYERMMKLLAEGRLPATIPVAYQGNQGLWTYSVDVVKPELIQTDQEILAVALIAIRAAYRTARSNGAMPVV